MLLADWLDSEWVGATRPVFQGLSSFPTIFLASVEAPWPAITSLPYTSKRCKIITPPVPFLSRVDGFELITHSKHVPSYGAHCAIHEITYPKELKFPSQNSGFPNPLRYTIIHYTIIHHPSSITIIHHPSSITNQHSSSSGNNS